MRFKTFDDMIAAAKEAITESSLESGVYIGCDSKRRKKHGKFYATYATVIIVHKDSKHGGKLFYFIEQKPDYGNMRQRLIEEVTYAIRAGLEVVDLIGDRKFEIHLDINPSPKHKSSCAVDEARGYVFSTFSMPPVLKPDGFAATHAADKLVRV